MRVTAGASAGRTPSSETISLTRTRILRLLSIDRVMTGIDKGEARHACCSARQQLAERDRQMSVLFLTWGMTVAEAQEFPRTEVSGGYQLLEFTDADETLSKGWYADVAGNLTKAIGVVFQVGGNYNEVTSSFTNATEFAIQAGGGTNIMFTDRVGMRGTAAYIRLSSWPPRCGRAHPDDECARPVSVRL